VSVDVDAVIQLARDWIRQVDDKHHHSASTTFASRPRQTLSRPVSRTSRPGSGQRFDRRPSVIWQRIRRLRRRSSTPDNATDSALRPLYPRH
jgi:hypothetical protein